MNEVNLISQTEALLRAIGSAVVRFQQIEQWLAEELALLLRMREKEDQYLVSAAMSFKQKVDLLVEIFPRKAKQHANLPDIEISLVKKALYTAEEYRNRVVHSFYAVDCTDSLKWVRIKGSLRGRAGFSLNSVEVNIKIFEECNNALDEIRGWRFKNSEQLRDVTAILAKNMGTGGL